jgi:Flp pilus assembly protein protease CpaA
MKSLLPFLLYMALLGGALTILLLMVRNAFALAMPAIMEHPRWPRIFKTGAPVPYGIAIAAAMLIEIMYGAVAGVVML